MAWVNVEDVEAVWLSSQAFPNTTAVSTWIGHAEQLVAFEFPDLQTRIDDEEIPLQRVKLVVVQMVLRVLQNPDNIRAKNEGIGDYTGGVTYAGERPGELMLTDRERQLLSADDEQAGEAFTLDTVSTTSTITHADACAINFGATYCSCGAILTLGWPLYEVSGG